MNSGATRVGGRLLRFGWTGCPDVLCQLMDGRLLSVEVSAAFGVPLASSHIAKKRSRCLRIRCSLRRCATLSSCIWPRRHVHWLKSVLGVVNDLVSSKRHFLVGMLHLVRRKLGRDPVQPSLELLGRPRDAADHAGAVNCSDNRLAAAFDGRSGCPAGRGQSGAAFLWNGHRNRLNSAAPFSMVRSVPEVKWVPRPLITATRTSAISSTLRKAEWMLCHICWFMALALSGRFSSIEATPSATVRFRVWKFLAGSLFLGAKHLFGAHVEQRRPGQVLATIADHYTTGDVGRKR